MRRIARLGPIVLALGACTHIPEDLRVVVDGSTLVFKKAPEAGGQPSAETAPPADAPRG